MLNTKQVYRGAVVAPHHLASTAGLRVLQEGGNAVEAMIAAASTIAVVYPHMNGLGGDNFWLINSPGQNVQGIDACGASATAASSQFYQEQGLDKIPDRGPLAALTVGGAVSGWQAAFDYSSQKLQGKLPLSRLLEDAVYYAREGVAVTGTLAANAANKRAELEPQPGFADTYINNGKTPELGQRLLQPKIAATLEHLVHSGLDDFYRGELANTLAAELAAVGSPLALEDFTRHQALSLDPLTLNVAGHQLFNMPPPTQGLASLLLLGVYARLGITDTDTPDYVHALVEATKCAFRVRDRHITDPAWMTVSPEDYLREDVLQSMAVTIDPKLAAPWPDAGDTGDTVWLGAIDQYGTAVSFIQSVYWEFGSGVVLPGTGITWQNRGTSFSLDPAHHNSLSPQRRPFHTIQPALARLADGRVMAYGTMGGEGQPQTQAMVFARHVLHNESLQHAITSPRWLLGRTWGSTATNLRIENRFVESVYAELSARGHDVERVGAFDEIMGHAGALVLNLDGRIEAAADPRSDGSVAGF
ncbi:MAG: gamma-glutamyltransferase family protein [Granulosicoccus sp.]|nr:gamma-glutamyltransferase family protein [Granulosicoccus sp.]